MMMRDGLMKNELLYPKKKSTHCKALRPNHNVAFVYRKENLARRVEREIDMMQFVSRGLLAKRSGVCFGRTTALSIARCAQVCVGLPLPNGGLSFCGIDQSRTLHTRYNASSKTDVLSAKKSLTGSIQSKHKLSPSIFNSVKSFSNAASKDEAEDDLNDLNNVASEDYDDFADPHSVDEVVKAEEKSNYEKYLPIVATWAPRIIIGGGISYVTLKTFLYVSNTLLGITLSDAVYFGLFSGFSGASLLYGSAFAYYQTFQNVRPEPVFEKAMKKIANDQNIIDVLGPIGNFTTVQSGFVRAYKLDGGDWGLGPGSRGIAIPTFLGENKKLVFRFPRVQMCFQVYGEKHQALCTVEAINNRGNIKFNLIMLDILTAGEDESLQDSILVYGNPERMYVRDQLTGFIDFKRNYLADPVKSSETRVKA